MHAYRAHGLAIRSEVELPELAPGPAPADVVVRVGAIADSPPAGRPEDVVVRAIPGEICLRCPETGTFRLRGGREITVDAQPGADAALLRAYLLGPVLALLLHQRGFLVLHASGVAMDGGAVLFLGSSGCGKSTTVAALHARGHPVVADDVIAVDLAGPHAPVALPGFPQLRLWPDALASLGEAAEALPRIHARGAKRVRQLAAVVSAPCPLRHLYVLGDGDALRTEPLRGHAALFELVQHAYVAPVLAHLGSPAHLAQCARLAAAVPVERLVRPRSLARLDELAAFVEGGGRDRDHEPPPAPGPDARHPA